MTRTPSPGRIEGPSGGFLFKEEAPMSMTKRVLLAAGILLIDLLIFFVPLTALFLIYIVLYNPPWFREFLVNLDNTHARKDP